ncbi:unnamed protein product [Rhizophagus irregularis]|nr:unnamed protein product [Rhizophagus irregularis]CAB5394575.1 unnamed protein product [Rhizophagus irregularis]
MCRIIRYDHVINLFQVCNFKYKKCLTEIEDKYDPLTKEGSLKKSFKICVGSELMEMLTADTKNHKIDGKKAPDSKDVDDKVKLGHHAMRILNKLLETISCKRARVYTIQCVNG